ncbi:MAG TPA: KH domain-containing protein [Pyrinomonadaceae bacterium]|nr:KH domain-containing protein [Pyrinomonadaceae bacterium]
MKETVEMLVKALVDDAGAVDVREELGRDGRSVIIEVRVAADDMGKLIGRQGRTVRALRSLFHAVSLKQGRRYILEIVE